MAPDHFLAFILASAVLIAIPGPSVVFTISRSIAFGRRAGLLSLLGNSVGILPAVLAVAFGVGAVVAASIVAFTTVKFAGAVYLVWLGVQAIRHRHDHSSTSLIAPANSWTLLRQGFVVGLTNPKTIAFFIAVLPQFVEPKAGPVWAQLLILGLVFQAIGLACDSMWALAAGTARAWFASSPKRMSHLTGAGGVAMIGLGGALAFSAPSS